MPASLEFCMGQVARMGGMFGAGRLDKTALTELAKALANTARDDKDAREITDYCLTERSQVPTPHDLIQTARSRRESDAQPSRGYASHTCPMCFGCGHRIVTVGIYSGVEPSCPCQERAA